MAKMDLPPEFVFEYKGKPELPPTAYVKDSPVSGEETDPDDAAASRSGEFSRSPSDQEKLKRKVTFANEPSLPEGEGEDSEDEPDEDEQQRYMKLRYKRSASLPSIELNRELARKIRRMLKDEEKNEEEALHKQLTDLKLSQDVDKSTSEVKYEYEFAHGQVLQVRLGDITKECADIIVNEAVSNLTHNGGVSAALVQKGGKEIQLQSDRWVRKHGPVPPGQVAVTDAGQLPCKWIIHAVGPIWRGGNWREDSELWDAMWNCLVWASKLHATSIAIPALGAAFLGFQKERVAYLLVDCIAKFVYKHPMSKLREIRIINHSVEVTDAVVFEVVGKFTSGCDTSESASDFEDEEVEEEDDVEDFQDDEGGETTTTSANTSDNNTPTNTPTAAADTVAPLPAGSAPNWIPMWRRQSIA